MTWFWWEVNKENGKKVKIICQNNLQSGLNK